MKFEDLTNEQIEKAKACTTREERLAFLKEYSIEIPDDMLDEIAGGGDVLHTGECPNSPLRVHEWEKTGRKAPGAIWGDTWPNYEERCRNCGATQWSLTKWL